MKKPDFEIIAGTYEEFLLGFRFHFVSKQPELVQTFAVHDHSSSIRCVAASGQYLATGAADDRIIVYDLKSRKEQCMLNHHNATISCLQFTNNHSHLISGSTDGELSIVRIGSWQLEKTWAKAHKGSALLDIAVHSSGKLALTLGSDCSLRTWNLVKGRQAYVINLNSKSKDAKSLDKITWAEDGVRFILSGGKYTEIWSIETGGILKVIEHDEKICSCIWTSDNQIVVGYEDGQIALIEIDECTKNIQKAHDRRVKALAKHSRYIVSASSTGEIKVWNSNLVELSSYDTGCRVTCLTIVESTVKVKEEPELLEVAEEKVEERVVKKSGVVIEVEDDDSDGSEYRSTTNQERVTKIKNKTAKNSRIKKKKKRKIEDSQEEQKEVEVEVVKQKKKKKVTTAEDIAGVIEEQTVCETMKSKINNKHNAIQKRTGMKSVDKRNSKKKLKQKP